MLASLGKLSFPLGFAVNGLHAENDFFYDLCVLQQKPMSRPLVFLLLFLHLSISLHLLYCLSLGAGK